MATELLMATSNRGKIRELEEGLASLPLRLRYLHEFPGPPGVAEVGLTYVANAILKATEYAKFARVCALADDSGLEVDALGGMPGVLTARYAGEHASDPDRIRKLLSALSQTPAAPRTARFVCSIALVGWLGPGPHTTAPQILQLTEGTCEGAIARTASGANGFGFDPVFVPRGFGETFAELPNEVKATISHRALALKAMREFLRHKLGQT